MRLSMIHAVAVAEVRSIRRLVRYRLFAILAVMTTLAIYLYYAAIHGGSVADMPDPGRGLAKVGPSNQEGCR
jgi:ABC-type transporter Mla maintaining outer membrane lipid asymmetry permease subunit MlaE